MKLIGEFAFLFTLVVAVIGAAVLLTVLMGENGGAHAIALGW